MDANIQSHGMSLYRLEQTGFQPTWKETLSIRSPDSTRLARATNFKKNDMAMFFGKLDEGIRRHTFDANDIWNVDETGITTVQTPDRVIAKHGTAKQVGAMQKGVHCHFIDVFCTW